MRTNRTIHCSAILLMIAGCDSSPRLTVAPPHLLASHAGLPPQCANTTRVTKFYAPRSCGTVVALAVSATGGTLTTEHTGAVQQAVSEWNTAVFGNYGLPRLSSSSGTVTASVLFDLSRSGTDWCGRAPSGSVLIIRVSAGSTCPGDATARVVQDLYGVVLHELGHVMGFSHMNALPDSSTGRCVMRIPAAPLALNQTPCEHERQMVYYRHGLRNTEADLLAKLVSPAVDVSPSTATVYVGKTYQFNAAVTVGDVASSALLQWRVHSSAVATILSSSSQYAVVQGQAEGQTTLRATVVEDPTIIWPTRIDEATITVQNPPVATVDISPDTAHLIGNEAVPLTGVARDSDGNQITGTVFDWSADDTSRVYLGPTSGRTTTLVSGKRDGSTTIRARAANGVEGTAFVTVSGCAKLCPRPN